MSLNLQVEHREFFQGLGRGRCSSAHNGRPLGISKLCVSERGLPGPRFQQDHTTPTHQLLGKLRNTKNLCIRIPTESQSKCHQASHQNPRPLPGPEGRFSPSPGACDTASPHIPSLLSQLANLKGPVVTYPLKVSHPHAVAFPSLTYPPVYCVFRDHSTV